MKGKFIVLEGIDGSGKGEQIKRLGYALFDAHKKNNILLTREPTYFSKAGIELRERLESETDPKAHAEEFTKLFVQDRIEHLEKQIMPALEQGTHVISDRYDLSTYAYQQTQGMSIEKLEEMHKGVLVPDITIIIDVSPEVALQRIGKGREGTEKFEKIDFMSKLRENYLKLRDYFGDRNIIVINGEQSIEEVYADVKKSVSEIIEF